MHSHNLSQQAPAYHPSPANCDGVQVWPIRQLRFGGIEGRQARAERWALLRSPGANAAPLARRREQLS